MHLQKKETMKEGKKKKPRNNLSKFLDYQNNFSCNIYNVDDDQKNEMKAIGGDLMIESIRSWELEKTMK